VILESADYGHFQERKPLFCIDATGSLSDDEKLGKIGVGVPVALSETGLQARYPWLRFNWPQAA
jgi:hypothetical protein